MEDKTDTHVYEMGVQPEEPKSVTIEVTQVPIEGEPLLQLDNGKNFLLEAGKEVVQKFRDFTLKPDVRKVDETFVEKNPFEGPIRRTQIPTYPQDIERMRDAEPQEEPKFITPDRLKEKVQDMVRNLPDRETLVQTAQEKGHEFLGWAQETFQTYYGRAKELVNERLAQTEQPEEIQQDKSAEEK